jgi:hypothetical protein
VAKFLKCLEGKWSGAINTSNTNAVGALLSGLYHKYLAEKGIMPELKKFLEANIY